MTRPVDFPRNDKRLKQYSFNAIALGKKAARLVTFFRIMDNHPYETEELF
ncbi:MAG: hypothetical protein JXR70_15940 [Spirochaetales bacterium]|nr:hypothetical protein [Spirochaetales bacterium]